MPRGQHYTSNTVSVERYCKKCERFTQHSVSGHRVGSCLACLERISNRGNVRAFYEMHAQPVEISPSCQCSAHRFPHVHADQSEAAKRGRWEAARRGALL